MLQHNLRHGAQLLLAVFDSSSEDEKDLDTTSVWIPSHLGVLSNLTPVPTNSDTMEEENQNKDGHVISYQQAPKKQTGLFPVYDKNGKLLSFCEEFPKESGKAMGARHESRQNPNALLCGHAPRQMVGGEQLPFEFGSTSYEPYEPATMIGRDDEKYTLVTTLCKGHAHVIILGGRGMGKTTLALSALCDIKVVEKHPSRHFISCEGIYSVEALLTELANALRIWKRENLYDEVLTLLCQPSNPIIICLDNFETIWEAEANVSPSPIEQFLSRISKIPMLSIILTLRGLQSPLNVPWSNNRCVLAVKPLDIDSAQFLFKNKSGVSMIDTYTEKLLEAVDGVPLAIKLLASIVQEGLETTETLWQA
ncbi:hypothetical protein K435DRAFT_859816 [Dendrothele bispora CBS 962.96]|uniref:ATPase AAA-type core domain-containing protein n=1 Tax=Dendrothele bispora (strain CBS 962.96) TaxID=1314807 RepID=A0A4V4HFJ2_DENBC|nr:hypothetical protein K435DRAFT_859816 [Dendrothele bispora CBS 962.96]